MRISMSVSIKIFFRSIIYLAICAVLFLLSNFFLMRFFNASNYLAEFHVASLKLGIVGYIVFSFLSYEYTNLPRTSALQEALEIIPSSRSKLLCSQSLVLISLLLIWSINIFGWILGKYVQLQIHYPAFFLNSIPSNSITYTLTQTGTMVYATWTNGYMIYTINTDLPYEEVLLIIDSLEVYTK